MIDDSDEDKARMTFEREAGIAAGWLLLLDLRKQRLKTLRR